MPHPQGSGEGRLLPLQAALQLAEEYGYKVFPCNADKAPLTPHGFKDASSNRDQIAEWWEQNPEALVGVPTGQVNKLYVIDVDPAGMPWYEAHREELTYWRIHRTRREGVHVLYQIGADQKFQNSAGKIAPGVDTRGEGGYVIWWPAAGLEAWVDDENAKPPVTEAKPVPPKANGRGNGKVKEGARHSALIRAAARLRGAGFNEAVLEAALLEVNRRECDPPQDEAEVRRIAADYSAKPEDKEFSQALEDARKTKAPLMQGLDTSEVSMTPALVKDLIFPGAWLLVGRPKIGKSWLLQQLMNAVAEGDTFLGYSCQQAGVLAIFGEDDDSRLQRRQQQLGVAKSSAAIHYYNRMTLQKLANEHAPNLTFVQFLDQWLYANPAVKLVLIDTETTVRQTWSGQCESQFTRVTESDYLATRTYDDLALRHGIVIILVNHSAKARGGQVIDPHEMINRSMTAVAGASGSIVLFDPPDEDPFEHSDEKPRVLAVRGRDLEKDITLAVHQDKDHPRFFSDGDYHEVSQSRAERAVLESLQVASPQIEEGDAQSWVTASDIAEKCGKSSRAVQRILSRMIAKGRTRWKQYRLVSKPGKAGGYRLDVVE